LPRFTNPGASVGSGWALAMHASQAIAKTAKHTREIIITDLVVSACLPISEMPFDFTRIRLRRPSWRVSFSPRRALDNSPGRKPWVCVRVHPNPEGVARTRLYRPFGASFPAPPHPGLAPWAIVRRPFGAKTESPFAAQSSKDFIPVHVEQPQERFGHAEGRDGSLGQVLHAEFVLEQAHR
jgi:hypothetical protein